MAQSIVFPCAQTRSRRGIFALLVVLAALVSPSAATAATPFQNAVVASGATTYYRFAEASGTSAFNEVAAGPAATYAASGVSLGRQGVDGAADKTFNLSGSGFLTAPDVAATSPTGDFALEAWIKPGAIGTNQHILSKYGHYSTTGGANDETDGYALRMKVDGKVAVHVNSGTATPVLTSTAKLEQGRWTHIVVSGDATSSRLYVNGQLDATALVGPLTRSPNPLYIGAASGPTYQRGTALWNGRIDEVAIYDRALSASEVADHFGKVASYPETVTSPAVSGNAVPGGTMTVSAGVWAPAVAPTMSYQWLRCTSASGGCTNISGATSSTYVVQNADAGLRLTARTTAANAAGSAQTTPMMSLPVGYAGAVGSASPSSYFRLGEASGTTTATNEYYQGGHGTYGSGITLGQKGIDPPGTSAQFSGTGAVTVPDSAGTSPTADFALEAWVRPNSAVTTPQHIVSKYGHHSTSGGANDEQDGYAVRTNADGSLAVYVNSGTIAPVLNSNAKLQAGRWYHLAVSAAGTSLKLYVNGQLDASATLAGTLTRSPNPLYIGAASGPSQHRGTAGFNGRINEVALYDAELSSAQVSDHFSRGVPYPEQVTAPQVSGRAVPGSTLTVSPGVYSPPVAPTVTHQWQRCTSATGGCTNIAGATGSTYVAQNADAGLRLTARTTATNAAGSAASTPQPTAQVGYAGAVVADGAGSFMRLGEASGSTAAKNEFSAAGEGTYGSGVTLGKPGIDAADTAAGFDGSGYVTGSLSGLNGPTADFAIEAWVKPSSIGSGAHLVSKYGHHSTSGGADDEADGFALRMKSDGGLAMHVNSAGIVAPVLNSNEKLVPGRWYHLVASAVSTNLRIFINGRLDSSVYLPNALTRSPNALMIGAASGPSYHRGTAVFSGRIDDVAIYDMPLSQSQVSDHFSRGAPAPENISPPAVSGTANDNSTLSATTGSWSPPTAPAYAYQWMACPTASGTGCDPIAGAGSATYSPKKGDIGKRLMVRVTASNASGALSVDSATTAAVVSFDTTDPELATNGALYDNRAEWLGAGVHRLHVAATDGTAQTPGSGITSVEVKVDAARAAYWSQQCPARNCSLSEDFELDTADLADGPHAISVIATDDAGRTTVRGWVVRTDRTKPTIDPSGEMWNERTAELRERSYGLGVASSDGSAADSSSGVRQQTLLVDGQQINTVTQSCAAGACDLSHAFTYANRGSVAARSVTVKVTDQAGNEATKSWAFGKQPDVCADDSSPTPTPATAAETDEAVSAADDALPAAVAPSEEATVEGETVEPSVDEAAGGVAATDAIAGATIATDPNDGFAVERAGGEKVCVTPATPDATPKEGEVVNGDVVVYPETGTASDTVVRPTPTGVETFTTVKSDAAAEDYSWKVSLEGDEELRETPDGGVQVVDPTPDVSEQNPGPKPADVPATQEELDELKASGDAPESTELAVPGADATAEQAALAAGTPGTPPSDPSNGPTADADEVISQGPPETAPENPPFDTPAAADTAVQNAADKAQEDAKQSAAERLDGEQATIAEINQQEPAEDPTVAANEPLVVAEFKPPTSVDADGSAVATTLETDGDTVTMHVEHQGTGHAYPIVADPWVTVVKYELTWKCCRAVYRSEVRVRWESRLNYIGHWWSSLIWQSSPRWNWGNGLWSIWRAETGWILINDSGFSPMYTWVNTPIYYTVPVFSHWEGWQQWEAKTELVWVDDPGYDLQETTEIGPEEPTTAEDTLALEQDVDGGGDDPEITAAKLRRGCRDVVNVQGWRSTWGRVWSSKLRTRFCFNNKRHRVVRRGAYEMYVDRTALGVSSGWKVRETRTYPPQGARWLQGPSSRSRQLRFEGKARMEYCPPRVICVREIRRHNVTWAHDRGSVALRNFNE